MKKRILSIVVLIICFVSSCGYAAHKKYYNDISDYQKIWELSGFRHGYEDKSPLFPIEIADLDVKKFYCRYDEQLPLGEGVQILLEIAYDDLAFKSELDRISEIAVEDKENFTDNEFLVYYIQLGKNGCWEYALIDEKEQIVNYIFLYNLPKKEIELENSFLPNNYVDYGE